MQLHRSFQSTVGRGTPSSVSNAASQGLSAVPTRGRQPIAHSPSQQPTKAPGTAVPTASNSCQDLFENHPFMKHPHLRNQFTASIATAIQNNPLFLNELGLTPNEVSIIKEGLIQQGILPNGYSGMLGIVDRLATRALIAISCVEWGAHTESNPHNQPLLAPKLATPNLETRSGRNEARDILQSMIRIQNRPSTIHHSHRRLLQETSICEGSERPSPAETERANLFNRIRNHPPIASCPPLSGGIHCDTQFNQWQTAIVNGEVPAEIPSASDRCCDLENINHLIELITEYLDSTAAMPFEGMPTLQLCAHNLAFTLIDPLGNPTGINSQLSFFAWNDGEPARLFGTFPLGLFPKTESMRHFSDNALALIAEDQTCLGIFDNNAFYASSNMTAPITLGVTIAENTGNLVTVDRFQTRLPYTPLTAIQSDYVLGRNTLPTPQEVTLSALLRAIKNHPLVSPCPPVTVGIPCNDPINAYRNQVLNREPITDSLSINPQCCDIDTIRSITALIQDAQKAHLDTAVTAISGMPSMDIYTYSQSFPVTNSRGEITMAAPQWTIATQLSDGQHMVFGAFPLGSFYRPSHLAHFPDSAVAILNQATDCIGIFNDQQFYVAPDFHATVTIGATLNADGNLVTLDSRYATTANPFVAITDLPAATPLRFRTSSDTTAGGLETSVASTPAVVPETSSRPATAPGTSLQPGTSLPPQTSPMPGASLIPNTVPATSLAPGTSRQPKTTAQPPLSPTKPMSSTAMATAAIPGTTPHDASSPIAAAEVTPFVTVDNPDNPTPPPNQSTILFSAIAALASSLLCLVAIILYRSGTLNLTIALPGHNDPNTDFSTRNQVAPSPEGAIPSDTVATTDGSVHPDVVVQGLPIEHVGMTHLAGKHAPRPQEPADTFNQPSVTSDEHESNTHSVV